MKYLFFLVMLLPSTETKKVTFASSSDMRQYLVENAEKYLGLRYRSKVGGNVMDCSGYVKHLMTDIGVRVTRSSVSQVHDGEQVQDLRAAKPGDIVVFKGRNSARNTPGHVGLVHHWANDTLYFIHSSVTKGITIDHLFDPYYAKRFLQVRDVISRKF